MIKWRYYIKIPNVESSILPYPEIARRIADTLESLKIEDQTLNNLIKSFRDIQRNRSRTTASQAAMIHYQCSVLCDWGNRVIMKDINGKTLRRCKVQVAQQNEIQKVG